MLWLVAEDEPDIRMLVATMIEVWGHKPVVFENGQKVWDWLDQVERGDAPVVPDLVLMDIRMPGKRGNELANRMRSLPQFANVPIVLMTAFSLTEGDRSTMMEQDGVDHIIGKPLPDFDQLRQRLHTLIDEKRGA